jgi:hypothetical protein
MARVHGKDTVIKLDDNDLSAYCKNSSVTRDADSHDTTGYGVDDYTYLGGLLKGEASISGDYDSTASTGPGAVIRPLIGTVVTFIRQLEGTGSGKPQESMSVLVGKFVETSPYNDIVSWSLDMTRSGAIDDTAQSGS